MDLSKLTNSIDQDEIPHNSVAFHQSPHRLQNKKTVYMVRTIVSTQCEHRNGENRVTVIKKSAEAI